MRGPAMARWYSPNCQFRYCFVDHGRRISARTNEANDRGEIGMKAIVVTDQAAGTAGMKLVERPEPQAAINDVVVQVHASGFVVDELTWPPTWTDRLDRDRTPSIPGHELAGVVTALGYGTRGLSVGQRVFGLTDWTRDGTLDRKSTRLNSSHGYISYAVFCSKKKKQIATESKM